ncbi:MAG: Sir2 family NAD-dependent protein deacetylase, partial [Deferribacterota bacterium]|nr:Sir2 family NAD-dependent protein deacetylase [Deferribacterota bacterium]
EDCIYEVHGSIHYLQCIKPCKEKIWENNFNIEIDFNTMRAKNIPRCKYCGDVVRPNILMFGDFSWVSLRADEQSERFNRYVDRIGGNDVVILEIGAGKAVPTIRYLAKRTADITGATIVRINPVEYEIEEPHIPIKGKALDVLSLINENI